MFLFVVLLVVFLGYKVFGAFIVRRWGSDDEVVGSFWDTPRFWDIPLGPAKLPSPGFLSFVTSGLSNLQEGISFVFQGSCHLHCLKILKLIPFFCLFACRIVTPQNPGVPVDNPSTNGIPMNFG